MWVEPRTCDLGRRKNDAFALLITLPAKRDSASENIFNYLLCYFDLQQTVQLSCGLFQSAIRRRRAV